jgi:hypothetical protein
VRPLCVFRLDRPLHAVVPATLRQPPTPPGRSTTTDIIDLLAGETPPTDFLFCDLPPKTRDAATHLTRISVVLLVVEGLKITTGAFSDGVERTSLAALFAEEGTVDRSRR